MIAKRNHFGCSYYAPFLLSDGRAADATSTDVRASNETRLCWTESLGDMLRVMSEFLMLATSRSPAQWMTLGAARESADDAGLAPRAAGHRPFSRVRARARTSAKHALHRG